MNKYIKWSAITLSILSIIPLTFVYIYFKDIMKLEDHRKVTPEEVDEILSRTITSAKFLVPAIFLFAIVIAQGVLAAFILKKSKSNWLKAFAITNVIFGGMGISNIFVIIDLFVKRKLKKSLFFKTLTFGGVTVATGLPLIATAMWFTTNSPDKPTSVKSVILSTTRGKENVIEIFTDGFDPIKAKPLFEQDSTFNDFIAMDRMVTGGYLTESSYPQMMGGFERNPFELRSEFESNNYKIPGLEQRKDYDAYLHDNFLETVLNRLGSDNISRGYIANPDDLGYFPSYFQHVSGSPKKVIDRNNDLIKAKADSKALDSTPVNNLEVVNWGQARDETTSGVINNNQNNAAVYKWVSSHIQSSNKEATGSRIFMQDSLTHSPRTTDENAQLSFARVEETGGSSYDVAYKGMHTAIHNFIEELKNKNPEAFDNSLIVIYGDHSDHANVTPEPQDDSRGYEKAHSQVLIKYPHTKTTPRSKDFLTDDKTPFFGPNLKNVISDYFNNKVAYDGKSSSEQQVVMSNLIKAHSKNEFMVVDGDMDQMNASFVKWDDQNEKLVASKHDFLENKSNWTNYAQWKEMTNHSSSRFSQDLLDLYSEMGWK